MRSVSTRFLHRLFLRGRVFAHRSEVPGSRHWRVGAVVCGGGTWGATRINGGWIFTTNPPRKACVRIKSVPPLRYMLRGRVKDDLPL